MRILVFSDIAKWEDYEDLVKRIKPEVVVLAGDLTSDGLASFWNEAVELIPAFQDELKRMGITVSMVGGRPFYDATGLKNGRGLDVVGTIKEKYRKSKEFLEIRKKIHVDKFYRFLKAAGKNSQVLVIKGDHDDDFEGDYFPEKIDKIPGCREISGKVVNVNGVRFLGLGFNEAEHLRTLKPLIAEFANKIDVVVTHCKQERVPMIGSLKPKLIIRGHFGSGKWLVNGIPSVFTMEVKYTTIELKKKGPPKILQYVIDSDKVVRQLKKGSCRPWFSDKTELERYPWLKPYPV